MVSSPKHGNEPARLDVAEVATTRLILPEQHGPVSPYPRFLGRKWGRVWYELAHEEHAAIEISKLEAAFDGTGGARLFRYESESRVNLPPFEISAEEIESMYLVSKAILVSPHHGYLPKLTEDEE